jgi:exo-beta-1,3-glucanase (GH17 family)
MRIFSIALIVVLVTAILGWSANQPQDAGPDVPQGKLNSLSFAPFWEGQGPMDEIFPSVAQIDSDLRLMSEKTHSIRTYASAEGTMPEIPGLARKYGLNMIQGAWLGGIKKGNKLEVDELIRSANANPDVVKRVIVGNEVLLRGDLEPEELIQYIRAVKQAVKQPVSYADVWSMYMKYPQLIKEVDFITIHILPYWEDEPIPVEEAPAHIERIYKHVQKEAQGIAPNKPILIGESGWPSEGRQRGWAVPSVVNEAKFIRGLIQVANANGFDYNIVEAINQSWKSALEGVVGANWGLFSVDRSEVFPLTGSVYENPQWHKIWMAAIGLLIAITMAFRKQLQKLPVYQCLGFLVFAQVLALLWTHQVELLWYTSYTLWQRLFTVAIVGLNAIFAGLLLQQGYVILAQQGRNQMLSAWFFRIYLVLSLYFVFMGFCLALNGRYISFPVLTASVPVIGVLGLLAISYLFEGKSLNPASLFACPSEKYSIWLKWLGYAFIVAGVGLVVGEAWAFIESRDLILAYPEFAKRFFVSMKFTLTNQQLVHWLFCLTVLALPFLASRNR